MRLLNILVIGALILAASFVYKIKFDSTLQAERVAKLRGELAPRAQRYRHIARRMGKARYARPHPGPGRPPSGAAADQADAVRQPRPVARATARCAATPPIRSAPCSRLPPDTTGSVPAPRRDDRNAQTEQACGKPLAAHSALAALRPRVDRNVKAKARLGLAVARVRRHLFVIALRLVMFATVSDGHGGRRSVVQDAVATARPDILDRNGEILATDVKTPSLFAEPRKIIDADEAVELLTAVLPDLDANEVRERLSSKRGFVWLKREITPKQQQEIHRLGIPGVGFLTENKRVYPQRRGRLARDRSRQHRQPGHRRH